MDDILVAGRDEHDRILEKVIRRATDYNLGFNFKKCQIKKRRVKYVGHMVSEKGLERAKAVMFWPGMTRDIENLVNDCPECAAHKNQAT